MAFLTKIATRHRLGRLAAIAVAAVACVARPALAQDRPADQRRDRREVPRRGERLALEPERSSASSRASSSGIIGSDIDFKTDLGYEQTTFQGPADRASARARSTLPAAVHADELRVDHDVPAEHRVQRHPLPGQRCRWSPSSTGRCWRFGYEYDFVYTSRGFVGVLLEGRYTRFNAELNVADRRGIHERPGAASRAWLRRPRLRRQERRAQSRLDLLQPGFVPPARLAHQGHDRHVPRRGHQRDDQLQRVPRRGGRLAADHDAARHRPRPRQPEVPGDVVRSSVRY